MTTSQLHSWPWRALGACPACSATRPALGSLRAADDIGAYEEVGGAEWHADGRLS